MTCKAREYKEILLISHCPVYNSSLLLVEIHFVGQDRIPRGRQITRLISCVYTGFSCSSHEKKGDFQGAGLFRAVASWAGARRLVQTVICILFLKISCAGEERKGRSSRVVWSPRVGISRFASTLVISLLFSSN